MGNREGARAVSGDRERAMRTRMWAALAAAAMALALAACGQKPAPTEAPAKVFAASSLTDVLESVGEAYAAEGGVKPTFVFAASSELARQIEQGAEADMFISADQAWMDYLAERDLIDPASRTDLLANKLVLIAPADHAFSLKLAPGADLLAALGAGKLAIADPDAVPAGRYARQALEALGMWESVSPNTARTESVRAALRLVETGEAAAGIVYATDARAAGDKVVVVGEFDPSTHAPIVYPMALVKGRDAGKGFALFLGTKPARDAFESAGFGAGPK